MATRRGGHTVGQTIGGVLVGFDYQVFRTTPPPNELVQKGDPVREVAAEDGGLLTITLPGDDSPLPVNPPTPVSPPVPVSPRARTGRLTSREER